MEQKNAYNAFDNTKPLFVAGGYGILAVVLLLIIPFLPFYDDMNVFEACYYILDSLSYAKSFEVSFYLLVSQWFVFAIIIFTVYLIIKTAYALVKLKRVRQYAALITDKIYVAILFMLVSFFLVGFVLNIIYSEFQQFGVYPIVPQVYVYFYLILALVGIVVNIICKNLCSSLKFSKKNLIYYIGIIVLVSILTLIAEYSSMLYAEWKYTSYSSSLFPSGEDGSMIISSDDFYCVNLNAFNKLMHISEVGPAFMVFVLIILLVDVLFVVNALIIAVSRFLCNNSGFIISHIAAYGDRTEEKIFTEARRFYAVKKTFGIWSIILGGITLLFHLIAYPTVSALGGISKDAVFSVAPVFGICLLIFGIAYIFGVNYVNNNFAENEDIFVNYGIKNQAIETVSASGNVSEREDSVTVADNSETAVTTEERDYESNTTGNNEETGMFNDF